MRRLGGTHYFSKVDLADAYNQIELGPESQKRLALSTHRGVLLQKRLPFGISSATGYFQDIMNQLTSDLTGVAVYLDDILISGTTAEDHLNNLRQLLKRLNDKGLRCRIEKCVFAEDSVTYLGHTISRNGISKGPKADAVTKMPAPSNVTQLRSFLGSVQFYNKFLTDLSTISGPLYHLTEKNTKWKWDQRLVQSFKQSMKKSKLPPRPALQEFLMQYRRMPLNTGISPSQLLNGRQIRTKIDSLLPSPAHIAQERQSTDATKSQQKEQSTVQHVRTRYSVGTPCYALYCGPRHTNSPRWVPATVTKVHGTRSFTVKVHPRGPLWKRHWEQLRPRYGISEDADPGFNYGDRPTPTIDNSIPAPQKDESTTQPPSDETNQQTVPEYGRHNPRRSGRNRKPRHPCNMNC